MASPTGSSFPTSPNTAWLKLTPQSPPCHPPIAAGPETLVTAGGLPIDPIKLDSTTNATTLKVNLIFQSMRLRELVIPSTATPRAERIPAEETGLDDDMDVFGDEVQKECAPRTNSAAAAATAQLVRASPSHHHAPPSPGKISSGNSSAKRTGQSPAFTFTERTRHGSKTFEEQHRSFVEGAMPFGDDLDMSGNLKTSLQAARALVQQQKQASPALPETSLADLLRKPLDQLTLLDIDEIRKAHQKKIAATNDPEAVALSQFFNRLLEGVITARESPNSLKEDFSRPPSTTLVPPVSFALSSQAIHKPEVLNDSQIKSDIKKAVEENFPDASAEDLKEMLELLMTMSETHGLIPQILSHPRSTGISHASAVDLGELLEVLMQADKTYDLIPQILNHPLSTGISRDIIKRLLSYCLTRKQPLEENDDPLILLLGQKFSSQLTSADLNAHLITAIQNISLSSYQQAAQSMAFIQILLSSPRASELTENELQAAYTMTSSRMEAFKTRRRTSDAPHARVDKYATILTLLDSSLALVRETREVTHQVLRDPSNVNIFNGRSREFLKRLLSYCFTTNENLEETRAIFTLLVSSSQLTVDDLKAELLATIQNLLFASDTKAAQWMACIQILLSSSRMSEFSQDHLEEAYKVTASRIEVLQKHSTGSSKNRLLDYETILGSIWDYNTKLLQSRVDHRP